MTFGAIISSAEGFIQIDQDYANHCVATMGTASTGAQIALPSSASSLIFIKPGLNESGIYYHLWPYVAAGHFMVMAHNPSEPWNPPSRHFNYVVTVPGATPPSNNYGLEVYRADGSTAFSSAWATPTILGYSDKPPDAIVTLSAPASGRSRFFLINPCCSAGYHIDGGDDGYGYYYYVMAKMQTANSVEYNVGSEIDTFNSPGHPGIDLWLHGTRPAMLVEI